jgi:hypothetical protein
MGSYPLPLTSQRVVIHLRFGWIHSGMQEKQVRTDPITSLASVLGGWPRL